MGSLLVKVKAKVAIHAHEKVRGVLDGEYGSVFKGRSLDFDDLREYTPGDDIKDIDWKATARSGNTKIRRYVAVRKHNILIVTDIGKNILADTITGEVKKDIVTMAAGVFGYIALKHGDLVGLVAGDSQKLKYYPVKADNSHLERILRYIDEANIKTASPSDLLSQLNFVAKNIRRKMFIVVIADDLELSSDYITTLRRLRAQHEMVWINIKDSSGLILGQSFKDIDNTVVFPDYIKYEKSILDEFVAFDKQRSSNRESSLNRLGITSQSISCEAEVVNGVYKLLERHKNARRR